MKRIFKKSMALLMAVMMTFAVGVTAFADTVTPSASDTQTVTIYGFDEDTTGYTVKAYHLVSAVYATNGLTGYEIADGVSIADIEAPTADEINAIAKAIAAGTLTIEDAVKLDTWTTYGDEDETAVTGSLTAGLWLILVEGSGSVAYNPMIVSNYYTNADDASSLTSGVVSVDGSFIETTDGEETVVYVKSTTTSIDKSITNYDENDAGDENGASFDVGDTVAFKLETTIPSYSDAYKNAVFTITDTLSDGLAALDADDNDIVVTVGEESEEGASDNVVAAGEDTYTVSIEGQVIIIAFASDYILEHGAEDVVVTYSTELDTDAVVAGEGNNNEVVLTYSNTLTTTATASDTVYVYTFDASVYKVSTGGSATTDETGSVTAENALSGAVFTIYTDEECTTVYTNDVCDGTATSSDSGVVTFSGLEEGTYYITETTAPSGYSINDTVYTITVAATYNADGQITEYTVTIVNGSTNESLISTYTVSYDDGEYSATSYAVNPTAVIDTKLSVLPSTGGIGVAVLVVISLSLCAVIGISSSRKKKTAA